MRPLRLAAVNLPALVCGRFGAGNNTRGVPVALSAFERLADAMALCFTLPLLLPNLCQTSSRTAGRLPKPYELVSLM